jgi:hypothetical protein
LTAGRSYFLVYQFPFCIFFSQVGQCVTACVENVIGRLLLRFLVVNSLISNASELGYSLVMLLFTQKKRQILVPDMAIDIIYVQVRGS